MQTTVTILGWILLAMIVCYVGFSAEKAVVFRGPWASGGLAMLGLAACVHARSRIASSRR
jgi:hypothetical protein